MWLPKHWRLTLRRLQRLGDKVHAWMDATEWQVRPEHQPPHARRSHPAQILWSLAAERLHVALPGLRSASALQS